MQGKLLNAEGARILMAVSVALNHWSEKTVGMVCDEKGLLLIFKELLRLKSWQIANVFVKVDELLELRLTNRVSSFIIVDSPTLPATEILRVLFKNPRARLTPTLVLCSSSNQTDLIIYEKIFHVTPCPKPLTANNFNTAFAQMISHWEQPPMAALRKVASLVDEGNQSQKIEILERLMSNHLAMPLALSAVTQLLLSLNMFKEAESKLLEQCKLHIKNPAMLALCAWFYLSNRMPTQAVRFLEKLKTIAPTSTLLNLDLATAYISSGELSLAIQVLHDWGRRNQGNPQLENFLAKLLIADGRPDTFERYGLSKQIMQKHLHDWEALENNQQNPPTGTTNEQNAS
jgi:hypothetical protein